MARGGEVEYEFNPIKEAKDGKEAERVIWSTKSLNAAVDALKKGLPLKANPFIGKVTSLLKPDLVYKRTKEEIEDYVKCKKDPVYFASKCFLKNPEGGLSLVEMRDYQVDYLHHLQDNRFSILLAARQIGKTLNLTSICSFKIDKKYMEFNVDILKKYCFYIQNNFIYVDLPLFEIYNLYCKQTLTWKIKYQLYKLIYKYNNDNNVILYKFISLLDLLTSYKYSTTIIDNIKLPDNIFVNTDTGYKKVTNFIYKKPFEIWNIKLENGYSLSCADKHIVFKADYSEIYIDELIIGDKILTDMGPSKVIEITHSHMKISMGDISVDDNYHRFYSNGILSHNSVTTAIYCLWVILFNTDKTGLILSKSGPAGRDLLAKIKDMYMYLPYHLKIGTMKWNQTEISFDNNSSISTESFSPTAGLGKTINFLILDEFAWCPPNDVELFYNNIIPTISADPYANVCIMSTQNGFNLFYKLWKAAIEKRNIYAPFKVDWYQVPEWDKKLKKWVKRDEKWKQNMIGVLGSEEAFYYQYGTQFSSSDKCLVSRECLSRLHDKTDIFIKDEELNITLQNPDALVWKKGYHYSSQDWYIILCDLAEGGGGDYTVFNILKVIDVDKYEQVGYWRSNKVDLEKAALDFWLMTGQLFNNSNCIWSIEWNTYGALFYTYLSSFNEDDMFPESSWRWNVLTDGIDTSNIVFYKKTSIDDVNGMKFKNSKMIPGIRMSSSNKVTACSLLKMMFEKEDIITHDIVTIGELENFEDRNGSGSYKANYGHDDIIMTFVQLPLLKQTSRYKNFIAEYSAYSENIEDSDGSFDNYYQNQNEYAQQFEISSIFKELPLNFR